MYSKAESASLKSEFWTVFGQYMAPVHSAEGEKVNWINYKTGEKDILFRMQADNKMAAIAIVLSHKDAGVRQLVFEQFQQFRALLQSTIGEAWQWLPEHQDEWGKATSRIQMEMKGVSIFNREDWPKLIQFFKPRMIALDAFWAEVKYAFEALR